MCDQIGKVIKNNPAASKLFGTDLHDEIFDRIVPLYNKDTGTRFLVQEAIKNGPVSGQEVVFDDDVQLVVNAGYLDEEQTNDGFF